MTIERLIVENREKAAVKLSHVSPGLLLVYVGGQQPYQEPSVGSNVLDAIIVMKTGR